MSDLLAIIDSTSSDEELVAEILRRHPDRVTVLVEDAETHGPTDELPPARALRERLANLPTTIEARTGAVVVGLANSRDQLSGWRFDRIISPRRPHVTA